MAFTYRPHDSTAIQEMEGRVQKGSAVVNDGVVYDAKTIAMAAEVTSRQLKDR